MPDGKQDSGEMSAFSKLDGTPFVSFSKPYLDFIGKGQLFLIMYMVMEAISLLLPFAVIYKAIDIGLFRTGEAKIVFAFVFSWLVIAFACWIGFQLWWDRKTKANNKILENPEFLVTSVLSEFVQTFGEWLGTLTGIIGAGVGLIAMIFLGDYADLFRAMGINFLPSGAIVIVAGPLIGFFTIIAFRFAAEQMRLFVSLVTNTKYIAINIVRAVQKFPVGFFKPKM